MYISTKDWLNYIKRLSAIDNQAAERMQDWIRKNGFTDRKALIDYAYGIATTYGEASGALSAAMYDAIAEMKGKWYPPAVPAPTPEYGEVAKTVNGILKHSEKAETVAGGVSRLVKRTGADTTLLNAERDGAQFAWVPNGDTCAFCLTLASRGWQYMSKKALKNGHAEHIHANCDCTYAIRFGNDDGVAGYDPDKYKRMYYGAEGSTPQEKINSLRRDKYEQNKDEINKNKRANWAKTRERKLKSDEGSFYTWDGREKNKKYDIIKPHNIIKNLKRTETGTKALSLIEENGTQIKLLYGVDDKNKDGTKHLGIFDPLENVINIYVDNTVTVEKTAEIIVHETYHLNDFGPCQKSEVYCMMQERLHHNRTDSLTADEVRDIIKTVKELYSDLPWS